MDQPVELVPLVCIKCSTPIPAEPEEVAWVCAQCGQGMVLDEANGLLPLDVNFSSQLAPESTGRPFWVAQGEVTLHRESYQGGRREKTEAERMWGQPRLFLVPAYACNLETLLSEGVDKLNSPPELRPGPAARFAPVTLWKEDVTAASEFIVTAIEAGRKDKVKSLDFTLNLSVPELWILP